MWVAKDAGEAKQTCGWRRTRGRPSKHVGGERRGGGQANMWVAKLRTKYIVETGQEKCVKKMCRELLRQHTIWFVIMELWKQMRV